MTYKVTVLTPTLVGDGRALAPIDYMIWKDQVNVLDQDRIFRLLSRGPRLDPYLAQLRRSDKLDFASWGGFAQNYAGRRIPFEDASSSAVWQQAPADQLHIPTFASGLSGPFLPASALKGALRTAFVFSRWNEGVLRDLATRMEADRGLRRPGAAAESMVLGPSGNDPMRLVSFGDSSAVARTHFKVYLVRVATLQVRPNNVTEAGWKQAPRGTSPRPEASAPTFAEMAEPGTEFSGAWHDREFLKRPEVTRVLHWRSNQNVGDFVRAANAFADHLLADNDKYATVAKLPRIAASVTALRNELNAVRERPNACLLNVGWGAGFIGKTSPPSTEDPEYRRILRQLPYYEQAIRTGMPFPKTRRVVFLGNQPGALPGWIRLEL